MQLAPFNQNKKDFINWIEPVEVWGNFRAARKAKIIIKIGKILKDGTIFMKGSNDANLSYGASYSRTIKLKTIEDTNVLIEVIDKINCLKKMYWTLLDLGPNLDKDFIMPVILNMREKYNCEEKILDSWLSNGFGKREKRKTLRLSGVIEPGIHIFENKLVIRNKSK